MLTFLDRISGNVIGVKVSGKVTHDDYQRLTAKFEELIRQRGKVSVFCELQDCQGVQPGAVPDELAFITKHDGDFERCAVIGEKRWHRWFTRHSRAYLNVKYFESPHFREAWEWVIGQQ